MSGDCPEGVKGYCVLVFGCRMQTAIKVEACTCCVNCVRSFPAIHSLTISYANANVFFCRSHCRKNVRWMNEPTQSWHCADVSNTLHNRHWATVSGRRKANREHQRRAKIIFKIKPLETQFSLRCAVRFSHSVAETRRSREFKSKILFFSTRHRRFFHQISSSFAWTLCF